MKTISFEWSGQTPLQLELVRPIHRVSSWSIFPGIEIRFVTLWREDGTGLRMFTEMHDVAERTEVGVMNFEIVDSEVGFESQDQIKALDLDSTFIGKLSVVKLVIEESGIRAESGVRLEASNGQSILIVAGGSPYSLFVEGVDLMPRPLVPEYPLADYRVVEF